MADEPQKISVQIAVDELKALSMTAGEAEADGKALVTLHFSPESVKRFIALWEDSTALEKSQLADSHTAVDRFIKTSEMRISFYEKIILLAGGSFALSLTFLGSLQRHTLQSSSLTATGRLKVAWILLLGCIIFSWLHNLQALLTLHSRPPCNTNGSLEIWQVLRPYSKGLNLHRRG
jgi:hypothetical protein